MDGLNAVLKILEEPPKNTFFFLTTNFLNQIPLTIQSRSLDIKIDSPNLKETLDWLTDYPEEDVLKALRLNDNLPLATKHFLDKGLLKIRDGFISDISGIIKEGKDMTALSNRWINEEDSINIKLERMSLLLSETIKYNADEARNLKQYGELPETARINETAVDMAMEGDDANDDIGIDFDEI